MFSEAVVFSCKAERPIPTLLAPVVFANKALTPTATCLSPVVLADKAALDKAVFNAPVVLAIKAASGVLETNDERVAREYIEAQNWERDNNQAETGYWELDSERRDREAREVEEARLEAERLEAIACLNLFINQPLAVADHPNVVGEAARLVSAIASAEGCLRTLQAAVTLPPGQSDES